VGPEGSSPWSQEPQLIVLIVLRFVLILSSHLYQGCQTGFWGCPSSFLSSVQGSMPPNCAVISCYLLSVCYHAPNTEWTDTLWTIVCSLASVCCGHCCVLCEGCSTICGCDWESYFIFSFIWITWTAYHSCQVLATVHFDVNREQNHIPVAEW